MINFKFEKDSIYTESPTLLVQNNKYTIDKELLLFISTIWNDFGYYTTFNVYAYINNNRVNIGEIKIYTDQLDLPDNEGSMKTIDYIVGNDSECEITHLKDEFCSLGQNMEFYENLKLLFPNDFDDILYRLRDISWNDNLKNHFRSKSGVESSLLRESMAENIYKENSSINGNVKKKFSFDFYYTTPYSENSTKIKFNYKKENDYFPYRINVLVGKNGVGKTGLLKVLPKYITGNVKDYILGFGGDRPSFSKCIIISHSIFDVFDLDKDSDISKGYVVCGLNEKNGKKVEHIDLEKIYDRMNTYRNQINSKGRDDIWNDTIKELIGDDGETLIQEENFEKLSSGQTILLLIITDLINLITENSLILIDELENHLHPNGISKFMKKFNDILEKYDSYAILATQSPLILQEVLSRNIKVFDKIDDVLSVRTPSIECFGNNISNIISEVFDVHSSESCYMTCLVEASKHMSEADILNFFNDRLSLSPSVFLSSLYNEDE